MLVGRGEAEDINGPHIGVMEAGMPKRQQEGGLFLEVEIKIPTKLSA